MVRSAQSSARPISPMTWRSVTVARRSTTSLPEHRPAAGSASTAGTSPDRVPGPIPTSTRPSRSRSTCCPARYSSTTAEVGPTPSPATSCSCPRAASTVSATNPGSPPPCCCSSHPVHRARRSARVWRSGRSPVSSPAAKNARNSCSGTTPTGFETPLPSDAAGQPSPAGGRQPSSSGPNRVHSSVAADRSSDTDHTDHAHGVGEQAGPFVFVADNRGRGAGHVAAAGNDDYILSLADVVLPAVKDGPGRHLPVGFLADLPDDARGRIFAELELAAGQLPLHPLVLQQQHTLVLHRDSLHRHRERVHRPRGSHLPAPFGCRCCRTLAPASAPAAPLPVTVCH